MGRIKWVAAAVLTVGLYGIVAVGGTPAGEAAVGGTHRMVIPPAAFIPTNHTAGYDNGGYFVTSMGGASFTAPLQFPVDLDHVRITKVTFWALDNDAALDVCLHLYRAEPKTGGETAATSICSTGASQSVRSFSDRTFRPRTGKTTTSFFLWLDLPPFLYFHGASIDWVEI